MRALDCNGLLFVGHGECICVYFREIDVGAQVLCYELACRREFEEIGRCLRECI